MHVYVFRNRRLYLHSSYAYFVCAGRACWAWKKQDIRDGTPRRGRQVSRIKKRQFQEEGKKESLRLWQYGDVKSDEEQVSGARKAGGRR
jgi:hypothetical protein